MVGRKSFHFGAGHSLITKAQPWLKLTPFISLFLPPREKKGLLKRILLVSCLMATQQSVCGWFSKNWDTFFFSFFYGVYNLINVLNSLTQKNLALTSSFTWYWFWGISLGPGPSWMMSQVYVGRLSESCRHLKTSLDLIQEGLLRVFRLTKNYESP